MTFKIRTLVLVLLILVLINPTICFATDSSNEYIPNIILNYNKEEQNVLNNIPNIGCKSVYIAEPNTGKIIFEKNAHEKMYPASTTKILTALLVLENCQMTDKAVVSQKALDLVPNGYSNAQLQAGEEHTILDLLYALLLPSANEAANVLAEHVSGSVESFVELCNKRAKELGCENLHFTNTNGMHDENHCCTAYDLYLIAKECKKYDIFNEIVKTKNYSLPSTSKFPGTRILNNTNELLLNGKYYYSNCNGIKTGYTTPAGQCLVASSSYNGLDLISVVLGGGTNSQGLNERFYDTKQLFEFVYDNYSVKNIAETGDIVTNINVKKATKDTANLDIIVDTDITTIVPNNIDKDTVSKSIILDENIVAPIKENQVLGQITYSADGLNYTTNILASHQVDKLPYWLYNTIVVFIMLAILFIILKIKRKHRRH